MRLRLRDVAISVKVALAPGFVLCTLIGMAIVAIAILGASKERVRDLSEGAFERYRLAAEATEATANAHTMLIRTLSVAANKSDKKRIAASAQSVTVASDTTLSTLQGLERHVEASDPAMQQIMASFKLYRGATKEVLNTVVDDPPTATILMADAEASFEKLVTQLRALKSSADAARAETSRAAINAASQAVWLLMAILIGATLLSVLATILISRAITRPVMQLTRDMGLLASGNIDFTTAATEQKDEIGAMARAVVVFKRQRHRGRAVAAAQKAEQARKSNAARRDRYAVKSFEQVGCLVNADTRLGGKRDATTSQGMSATVEETSRQANTVASAAEEASTNIQTVASATEELSSSVSEIRRQVAHSTKIAGQAVDEASRPMRPCRVSPRRRKRSVTS